MGYFALKNVPGGASIDRVLQGGGKRPPPPYAKGFKNPVPPPTPKGFGKFLKLGKFLGVGIGAALDILLNTEPLSDGTIPDWVKNQGEKQVIEAGSEPPFLGGQTPSIPYRLNINYAVRSKFDPPDAPYYPRVYETAKVYYGIITEASAFVNYEGSADGDTIIWTVVDYSGTNETTFSGKPAGTSAVIDPNSLSLEFLPSGATPIPDDNPPPENEPITTKSTWNAGQALIDTLSAQEWYFSGFSQLPNFNLPSGGVGFAPLGTTAESILGKKGTNTNINTKTGTVTQTQTSTVTTTAPPPTETPDPRPKSDTNKTTAKVSLPPIPPPPPAKNITNKNPTPRPGSKTQKFPEPKQTKIDKCAGSCGGSGGGTQLSPGSPAAANLIEILNDQLVQNPLLKKIDATTVSTNGIVTNVNSIISNAQTGLKATSEFVQKAWKATKADKVLATIGTATSLHNAAMLSQNAAQSIGDVATSALNLFNIKGFDGNPVDVNEAIGGFISNKLTAIFGATNLNAASEAWLKLNRIHQAASSMVYALQGTKNVLLEADEITGGHVAKIGNALQEQELIEPDTYDWMNPQPDYQQPFNGILGKIDAVEDMTNRVSSVVNTGLEIKETSTELVTSSQTLVNATTDFINTKTEAETTAKAESESPDIDRLDLIKSEPAELE